MTIIPLDPIEHSDKSRFHENIPSGFGAGVSAAADGARVDESLRVLSVNRTFDAKAVGVYVQDLVQVAPAWMVVLIATREFIVTGLRLFALGKGKVLPAEAAGKHKTISQMVAISLTLIYLVVREAVMMSEQWHRIGEGGIWCLMLITVALTMTSGISFLWRHRKIIMSL